MPKMKRNKSVSKRFKITAKGKVKRRRANKSHILTKKAPKRKRHLRDAKIAAPGDARRVKKMLLAGG
ncbi:MAG: 50S ribosomal protein L35 [Longimicrobiales bacterium]